VPAVSENEKSPTFAPLVAYSTGLIIGRFLVDIVADRIAAPPRKGNRMSTAKADVLRLLEDVPGDSQRARTTFMKDYPHPQSVAAEGRSELWEALREIAAPTAKHEVLAALDALPDGCSVSDLLEVLDEREDLRRGLASAIYEPLVSQEEMEALFAQWAHEASSSNAAEPREPREELPVDSPMEEIEAPLSASYEVSLTRAEVLEALDDLPDGCAMEAILHTLSVREQIKQGIWSLENEPTFTQEEVEQSLSRWHRRPPTQGNSVSTASIEVPPLPPPRTETEEEYAERIRNAIRRGIKAAEEGRVYTHEEAMRRLAPWLGD
jgi:hypothetical protein